MDSARWVPTPLEALFDPTVRVRADARELRRQAGAIAAYPRRLGGGGSPRSGWPSSDDAEAAVLPASSALDIDSQISVSPWYLATTGPVPASGILSVIDAYLVPATLAMEPLLLAHGLTADASLGEVTAIEGLLDALVAAAVEVRAAIDAPPIDGGGQPGGGAALDPELLDDVDKAPGQTWSGWGTSTSNDGRDVASDDPFGAAETATETGRFEFTDAGEPCYPDIPGFEGYEPKCTDEGEPGPFATPVDCTLDPAFVDARQRLERLTGFDRLPDEWWSRPYKAWVTESVTDPVDPLYTCSTVTPSSNTVTTGFAACCGPDPYPIRVSSSLISSITLDLGSILISPDVLRAGIVLHEHVHRADILNHVPPAMSYLFVDTHHACIEDEYTAAFGQAKYYGATDCLADAFGVAYAVNFCVPPYTEFEANLWAVSGFLGCLLAEGLGIVGIILITLQLIADPVGAVSVVLGDIPGELAAAFVSSLLS